VSRPYDKCVYVAETEHLGCKIGISGNPALRLPELAKEGAGTATFFYATLHSLDAFEVEASVKRQFAARRIKGEYFDVSATEAANAVRDTFARIAARREAGPIVRKETARDFANRFAGRREV
jgi:hypothetical protein